VSLSRYLHVTDLARLGVATTVLVTDRYLSVTFVGWCGYHCSVTLSARSAILERIHPVIAVIYV
jgi:hypothetical protein